MNPTSNRSTTVTFRRSSSLISPLLVLCLPLFAPAQDWSPTTAPDPAKGWPDSSPVTPEELARLHGKRAAHASLPAGALGAQPLASIVFDHPEGSDLWAAGPHYKASFGRDGFTFVPFFGADAPRIFPVRFELRSVIVGAEKLPLAVALPVRDGMHVAFDRGAVQERYDLSTADIEQTLVIDCQYPGDVDISLLVHTELTEDAGSDGIQFGNQYGRVDYGQAHIISGKQTIAVATNWDGDMVRIHVPAALRGAGPLIVDPIIHSSPFTGSGSQDSTLPDIAYDYTYDQFLVVWQYAFSATDHDIFCEFRQGDGSLLAGSLGVIDITTADHQNPRVANLNAYDRFLVVMQRLVAGNWQVWGRLCLAGQPVHPTPFAISNPTAVGQSWNPDIGGDSGTGSAAENFLVVWEQQVTANDYDIDARIVRSDAWMGAGPFGLADGPNAVYTLPSVSQSNGNGFATAARWVVAYQFRYSSTDNDIFGCSLAQDGTITAANVPIDATIWNDLYPSVSSPNTDSAGGNPRFLVTYERQNPASARAAILNSGLAHQMFPMDLTGQLSLNAFWVRAECDGNRFAVVHGGFGAIGVSTLAFNGTSLISHDVDVLPGVTSYPRICSKRSGGGPRTQYGVTYVDEAPTPDQVMCTLYSGRVAGASLTRRGLGCNGLGINQSGNAYLGHSFSFSLSNVGFDFPGFAVGRSVPANTVFCGACQLGVDTSGVTLVPGPMLTIVVPTTASLVGYVATVQGLALGSGPCQYGVRFSDAFDFTIR